MLPSVVQKWLTVSGVSGSQEVTSVRLKQKGQMRLKPDAKWMEFSAEQYFNLNNPGFIWNTKVITMLR